jgi:hypothetical protein
VTTIEPARTRLTPSAGTVYRQVTGTAEEVAATVAIVRNSGHLLACTPPRQLGPDDPRVTVIVTVRAAAFTPARPVRRWVKPTVITGAVVLTIAGIGYTLSILAASAARAVATPAVLGCLFILAVIAAVALRSIRNGKDCPGLHCSGCGRHS